ncbi:hydroxyethylthiazole kinase [Desulfosporosinus acidiphilus SJ4]|uniref:Hydroxyethylthiazole kinase n=1 Tax=Desulfosporosinus acidiphilus (strain DSM 22704 / JCM 16185 / SJ4) TaxID=646529 RepID=I4D697_DESAJ|nr:hydroxyethylthiazole kinase [Desulfosporosinus acidiphilus]AFM41321.1 hydroxyethylthiazole kinase [Desulfosporosinus acidiphilus SJ4]
MELRERIMTNFKLIKENKPLIHHITNYVTVNDCANIVLALGGSPVMADDQAEVAEMVGIASSLVLNIGTLNSRTIDSMLLAGTRAKELGVPIILDPVGVGATKLRTQTAQKLIEVLTPEVIRGNMSEISVIAGQEVAIKGVDSLADENNSSVVAKKLAFTLNCVIAITGKTDVVSDGQQVCKLNNGHRILADVTGTGCMTTSLIGTFCGVTKDYFAATIAGITCMGLAGEIAHASLHHGEGIGTFRARLFDSIYNLTPELLAQESKISYE